MTSSTELNKRLLPNWIKWSKSKSKYILTYKPNIPFICEIHKLYIQDMR